MHKRAKEEEIKNLRTNEDITNLSIDIESKANSISKPVRKSFGILPQLAANYLRNLLDKDKDKSKFSLDKDKSIKKIPMYSL